MALDLIANHCSGFSSGFTYMPTLIPGIRCGYNVKQPYPHLSQPFAAFIRARFTLMKSSSRYVLLLACLMIMPSPAISRQLSLEADLRYFDYEEFGINSQSLNHETGLIPGFRISGGMSGFGLDHTLEFDAWAGVADYNGRTQSGQSHTTQTDETIYRLLYRVDWHPNNNEESLYAKIYWQNWDRDIQPANGVSGLFERYRWWTTEAGLRAIPWQQQNRSLAFELGVLQTRSGDILIDLSDSGYGKPSLDLGNGLGTTFSLNYAVEHIDNTRLEFTVRYDRWKFGRSDTKAVSGAAGTVIITEPQSESNNLSFSAGYNLGF
jgi:hypothetical protein